MNDTEIKIEYIKANETDSFKFHNDFLNTLLNDDSQAGIEKHYFFFQNASNSDLKRILGKGFFKRGEKGFQFLRKKLETEIDDIKKSNVIHLLGLSGNSSFLVNILPYINDSNYEIRYKTIISIGWLGDMSMIDVLEIHYTNEREYILKGFSITAMRQIYFRTPDARDKILNFLFDKLKSENNIEITAIIIVVIQDLTKTKYGLKEDTNTGEISGKILKTKEKIIKKYNL